MSRLPGSRGGAQKRIELVRIAWKRQRMPLLLPASAKMIPGNSRKEAAKRSALRIKSFRISNQRHENLLRHVFRQSHVCAHMQSRTIKGRVPATVKQRERLFVAGYHPPEQQTVAHQFRLAFHRIWFDGRP